MNLGTGFNLPPKTRRTRAASTPEPDPCHHCDGTGDKRDYLTGAWVYPPRDCLWCAGTGKQRD